VPAASVIKVMIVDDQQSMRIMLRSNLRELGFTDTRDKSSALDALKSIRNDRVHLIISDYNMPDMDGLQFLEEVRKDAVIGKTAFIMLTGSSDRDVVQRAAALGVNNYLVKPFATAALKDKIERIFGALS
jgi:two-component system chemotaxis response regulator CheY